MLPVSRCRATSVTFPRGSRFQARPIAWLGAGPAAGTCQQTEGGAVTACPGVAATLTTSVTSASRHLPGFTRDSALSACQIQASLSHADLIPESPLRLNLRSRKAGSAIRSRFPPPLQEPGTGARSCPRGPGFLVAPGYRASSGVCPRRRPAAG